MEAFAERGRACCRHYPRGQLLRTQQVRGSAGLADRRKRRFSTWRRRICQVAWALDDPGLASGCASRSGQRLPAPRRNYILSKERAVAFDACSPGGFRRVDMGLLFVKSSPQEKERARARCGSCGAESLRPYVQRTAAEESSRDCDLRMFRLRYITDYYSRRALVCACAHHRIGNNLAVSHLKQHPHTFLGQVSLSLFHPHDTSIPLDAISSDRSGRAPDAPPVARPCLQLAEPKRPRRDRGPLPLFSEFAAYRTAAQVAAHEGRLAAVRPFSQ